ncbi:MAG: sulfatase-like hydrolase/transferase [Roseibacillus sp.]
MKTLFAPALFVALSTILAAQSNRFQANFESGTIPQIGTANYNTGSATTAALQVSVASAPDSTLGNNVLLLESNGGGQLAARLDFDSAATLQSNSITIDFDLASRRTNGSSKTTTLSGYTAANQKIFSLVLGDFNAFGNGNGDRQRPGYETSASGKAILPGSNSPGAYWWGADTNTSTFDASKDAHFTLTIESSSWSVSTTNQNGTSFSSDTLPHYDGGSHTNLAYLTLATETGNSFGLYWDNLVVNGFPDNAALGTYYWTGDGDGSSLFQENNWNTESNGTGSNIPAITSASPVNAHLIINNGSPGGGGANGELDLGLGSLLMNGGSLNFSGTNGITGGNLTINNGSTQLNAEHVFNSELNASAGTIITLSGAFTSTPLDNSGAEITAAALMDSSNTTQSSGTLTLTSPSPFKDSTFNFTGTSSGTLALTNLSPSEVNAQWLDHILVNGAPAIATGPSQTIQIFADGSVGTLVTLYEGFIDLDGDQMNDAWEQANFGDLSRDGDEDFDDDGLTDLLEFQNNTQPKNPDSDNDLLTDGEEINLYQTDPLDSDSDDDSNPDGFEIAKATDPTSSSSKTERPNIIFILADDLGYGDIGVLYQNSKSGKKFKTPFFDQMAADGLMLDRHYCPAPVCAPSRASLLTGLHQGHANVRDNQFDKAIEDNHSLATILKAAGYSTNIIGKWGLQGGGGTPWLWPAYPTKRGFDYFYGYVGHGDGHTHYPDHVTDSRGLKRLYDQNTMVRDDLDKCFTPDLFTARAKKLITDEVNDGDEQPFFLYLAYDTPHAALQLPTIEYPGENGSNDLDDSGLGATGGVQWNGVPGNMINTATGTIDSYRHPDYTTGVSNSWTDVEERFATLVRRMDDNLGDLRKTLVDLGIADNTLIVYTSDNGPHSEDYLDTADTNDGSSYLPTSFQSYGPFEGQKRDCWEGGIREPSFVCWPNTVPQGKITTQHSQFHDWLPTFCEVAGVDIPARTDGVSLMPTLLEPDNPNNQETPTTYIEYSTGGNTPNWSDFNNHGGTTRSQTQVIFLDGYKGIRTNPANANGNFQIYETIADPDEATNLRTTSPYFGELNERMKDRVLQIRQPTSSASRPWDSAPVPVPTTLPSLINGLGYQSYTGIWPWIPDFAELTPLTSGGLTSGIDLTVLPAGAHDSGLLFTGYLNIPTTGTWNFALLSDSGAFLRIHDVMVVDDDYEHDGTSSSGNLLLEAGLHPFRLYYKNSKPATPSLDLTWSGPNVSGETIPTSAFFTEGQPDPIPVATPDNATTEATASLAQPVTISPLDNDLDDGFPTTLSLASFTTPRHGTVTQNGNNLIYTPNLSYYGPDSFAYTVTDGLNFVTGTISVATTFDAPDIWLPFNECGGDETYRANGLQAGSLAATTARAIGKAGLGLTFNGINSEFALNGLNELPVGSSPRTAMAWIRVPAGEALENQAIFGYGVNSAGERFTLRLNGGSGSNNPGSPHQAVRLEVESGNIIGNAFVDDGQWHHIAVVCEPEDNGTLLVEKTRIYVDGILDTDADTSGLGPASAVNRAMNTGNSTATFGGASHSSGFSFLGEIDEFRLYPRALSSNEILAISAAGLQAPAAWHRRYFGDAVLTSWESDADEDGFSRLAEYAFGGNPLVPDSLLLSPVCSFDNQSQKISISFRRKSFPEANNLSYFVETSTNLVPPWGLAATETMSDDLSVQDCLEWATFETDNGADITNPQFLRVKAEFVP